MDVDVMEDLNAVNDQLQKLVEELNRISATRENLMQQVQNLNGVAMYLRGKLPPAEEDQAPPVNVEAEAPIQEEESLERSNEYPVNS